jgi:glutaminyl-peptide cyclotransferase
MRGGRRLRATRRALVAASALGLVFAGCGGGQLPRERPEVLRVLPHDSTAYTQGLLFHEGRLFESTGQYGSSSLREVALETGEVVRTVPLGDSIFGEGLERVGDRLIQLTWKEGVALVYDLSTLEQVATFEYEGEGWGLCYDGESLFMTTGGSFLHRRDPRTFAVLESLQITDGGSALFQVNELACVGEHVYGNVYLTDRIVRIDKATGQVIGEVDGSSLVPPRGRPRAVDAVLNGIAHDPESGLFYLTGKLWPVVFEVRFVPE